MAAALRSAARSPALSELPALSARPPTRPVVTASRRLPIHRRCRRRLSTRRHCGDSRMPAATSTVIFTNTPSERNSDHGHTSDPSSQRRRQLAGSAPPRRCLPSHRAARRALPRPRQAKRLLECGSVVTRDVRLSRDLRGCTGNGLVVGADGVDIDLNGHLISGTGPFVSLSGIDIDAHEQRACPQRSDRRLQSRRARLRRRPRPGRRGEESLEPSKA